MIEKILKWFKKQAESIENWKKEQDRQKRQWEKKQNQQIPQSLDKLVKMYPLLKFMKHYNPLLIDPEGDGEAPRDQEMRDHIKRIHAELIEKLCENATKSKEGKHGRRIRPATVEELERYERMTTNQEDIWKVQHHNNMISSYSGIPEVKRHHLKKMGSRVGARVFLSSSNVIDPYFPELVSIGDNTILGLGASIFCHEFIDGELYVGEVEIGKDCLVGFGSIILPGTKMEKKSILTPGFLMSDLKEETMAKGLDGSKRLDKDQSKELQKRDVVSKNFTLHDYFKKLIFPKENPLKTAASNTCIEWQKSPLVSQSFRQKLLRSAGITIGKNVTIEGGVHFDTFYPEKISIGDGVVIKKGATIITHEGTVHNFRTGPVEIGNDVVIESGAKILPGVKIGKRSRIFPYSVVTQDIKPDSEFMK